jgi:hypothetical protein
MLDCSFLVEIFARIFVFSLPSSLRVIESDKDIPSSLALLSLCEMVTHSSRRLAKWVSASSLEKVESMSTPLLNLVYCLVLEVRAGGCLKTLLYAISVTVAT